MEKYTSYHFSPLNNRSMLMPRIPKGEKYICGPRVSVSYPLLPEDRIDHVHPYYQVNKGVAMRSVELDGQERNYAVYVPKRLLSKGAAAIIFPDSGVMANDFLSADNWKKLSEDYKIALIVLESKQWNKDSVEREFDYAQCVVETEFRKRSTVDICESFIYPIGLGDGAYIAAAFALTYSATFPAFAADGDCGVDEALFEVLRRLPSDGVDTQAKSEIAMPGFVIDRSGNGAALSAYLKETIRADEEFLTNRYARVYLERERIGDYFVNEQPVAQVWLGNKETTKDISREELNEAMIRFVLRFARWGGFGNNHLKLKRSMDETGTKRVWKEVDGQPRYWDVYVPSSYRPDDGKEYPLVVAIHGFSCNSEYFAQTSDWHRLAEARGFFVVFVSAYPRNAGRSVFPLPGWNVWPSEMEGVDECDYFKILLDDMEENYHIDLKRIYAVGHSNGSFMTQELARVMPERFAAFGPTGALAGFTADCVKELSGEISRPVWFMMGEYDIMDPNVEDGSLAKKTLASYCKVNHVDPNYDNWYVNGNYHTLVMYDKNHAPMVQYTIIKGCPHTYTAEMAQLTWDTFLCHWTREANGTVIYHG